MTRARDTASIFAADGSLNISTSVNLGDNEKAYFGTSNDLQIYHDGSNSYFTESGTGRIYITTDGPSVILGKTNGENMLIAYTDGSVDLYYDNTVKLSTTSTGIDVTGTVTADGLEISGEGIISGGNRLTISSIADVNNDGIRLDDSTTSRFNNLTQDSSGNFKIQHWTGSTWQNNFTLTTSGAVGIGTTSPTAKLELNKGSAGSLVTFTDGVSTNFNFSTSGLVGSFGTDAGGTSLALKTAGSERMRIDSSGKVGINQTSMAGNFALHVTGLGGGSNDARALILKGAGNHTTIGSTGPTLALQNTDSTTNNIVKLSFESASAGETVSINAINTNHTSHYGDMAFNTRGSNGYSEKMRIMANGNVGISTSSPTELLDLGGTLNQNLRAGLRTYLGTGRSTAGTILGHSVRADTGASSGDSPMEVTETNSSGGAPAAIRMHYGRMEFHTASSGTAGATFDSERMRIDSSGRVTMPYALAVSSYLNVSHTHPGSGANKVNNWAAGTGTGHTFPSGRAHSSFNYTNSRFTAPVAGLYLMSFKPDYSTAVSTSHYVAFGINGGTRNFDIIEDIPINVNGGANFAAYLYLNQNDYVEMYTHGGTTYSLNSGGNQWNTWWFIIQLS